MTRKISKAHMSSQELVGAWQSLREPLIEILTTYGPSDAEILQYLLLRNYDILVYTTELEQALTMRLNETVAQAIPKDKSYRLYHLPGQADAPSVFQAQAHYPSAYLDLYIRYQALRSNPELATMPESIIEALYPSKVIE